MAADSLNTASAHSDDAMKLLREKLPKVEGYEVLEKIGEGGIGSVFKGVHLATNRHVAIKLIETKASSGSKALLRAEREFRSANRLVHPNIVQALDLLREEAKVYLVMEYVDGESLGARIERLGRLSETESVSIIAQVGQALHYIHKRAMVHRDVKPDNILITKDDKAKLTDFGIVKEVMSVDGLTDPATALGTPHFMAPELYAEARSVDARTDVYALGATLYNMVTGKLPFGSVRTLLALVNKVSKGAIVLPRQIVPDLSDNIDGAIRKAMSTDPAARHQTSLEFVKHLMGKGRRKQSGPSRAPGLSRVRPNVKSADTNADRRAAVRYSIEAATDCAVETSLHSHETEADIPWPATVLDLSCTGVSLILSRRLERGTMIVVDLEGPEGAPIKSLQARVVRLQSKGYGQFQVGCQLLEPLTPEEVRVLI